tara:strand:+ start:376 stop:534 length:159 start_codon:yes stop_codon:yes gene_type:complete
MKSKSLTGSPAMFDKGKKNKATRQAITMGGTPKDRSKSKHKPLPGYKQRKRK